MSKYKNELGTLNSERLLEIHNFAIAEHKKGNYELYQLVSDFAEQQCTEKEGRLEELEKENSRLAECLVQLNKEKNRFKSSLKEKDQEIERLKLIIQQSQNASNPDPVPDPNP